MLKLHSYPRRMQATKLLISLCVANQFALDFNRLADIAACIEAMNLGFYLFEHLEKREELLGTIPLASLVAEKMTEKNLILSGDFFYSAA
jgi:hypothetical protein